MRIAFHRAGVAEGALDFGGGRKGFIVNLIKISMIKYLIRKEILDLANSCLDKDLLNITEEYARESESNNETIATEAIHKIFRHLDKLADFEKKPLFYAMTHAIGRGITKRDAIRYLGDYIDKLVKAMCLDKTKNKKCLHRSLSTNICNLKQLIPKKLYDNITNYNKIYVYSKHVFPNTLPGKSFSNKRINILYFYNCNIRKQYS